MSPLNVFLLIILIAFLEIQIFWNTTPSILWSRNYAKLWM